jgi:hypothetical protein
MRHLPGTCVPTSYAKGRRTPPTTIKPATSDAEWDVAPKEALASRFLPVCIERAWPSRPAASSHLIIDPSTGKGINGVDRL